jgi:aspartyl-tRNA(Asn)/glutamyl-tRNA(Gln) amidotransferase subunit A
MTHPQDLTLVEQAAAIADGSLKPAELLDATLARIEERSDLNAVVATFPDEAAAMLADAPAGPLHGVPLTVKDMFSLPWRGFNNGSGRELGARMMAGPLQALVAAGAVIVGVDNQHELGLGTTGLASPYGPARNPVNTDHCAGGSSSGSAAAVGGRLVAAAIGSDSGGSTRIPASWCGILGLKVTYGSVPYDGYTGFNSSLSGPGTFARDAADARLLTSVFLSRDMPAGDGAALRVGVVRDPFWDGVDPEVAAACEAALGRFADAGDVTLPAAALAAPAGAVRAGSELGLLVMPELVAALAPSTRALVQLAATHPAQRLVRADRVRARLRRGLVELFEHVDVLAWPATCTPAPPIADPGMPDGPNLRQAMVANLTGAPAMSIPVGTSSSGLPIGLQLLAPWGREDRLLDAAALF